MSYCRRLTVFVLLLSAVLALPAEETRLFERVVALNRILEPELDAAACERALAALCERAEAAIAAEQEPRAICEILCTTLLADRETSYLSNRYWRDSTLSAALLRRQGNCLASALLFAVVGDELDLPLCAVEVPGHAFARWDDGETRINIETTSGQIGQPDAHFLYGIGRAAPADRAALDHGASLSDDALVAVLHQVAAGHLRGQNRIDAALAQVEQALALTPGSQELRLLRIRLLADRDGDRAAEAKRYVALLNEPGLAPSVRTGAMLGLARIMGARGEHDRQRHLLLQAWRDAPRSMHRQVLGGLMVCHRSLDDRIGALRYQELATALVQPGDPSLVGELYNLSIAQDEAGEHEAAIRSCDIALRANPEAWNVQLVKAGYLHKAGETEAGRALFDSVAEPRANREFYLCLRAWYHGVASGREDFYRAFERCLSEAHSPGVIEWILQEDDFDALREEPRFQALLAEHRPRIMAAAARATTPTEEAAAP